MDNVRKDRPKYLNLLRIHLPVTGVVSIIHRITGVVLFLSLPVILFALEQSLSQANFFNELLAWMHSLQGLVVVSLISVSIAHHVFAGLRFLLIDLGIGIALQPARRSAWIVLVLDGVWIVATLGVMR